MVAPENGFHSPTEVRGAGGEAARPLGSQKRPSLAERARGREKTELGSGVRAFLTGCKWIWLKGEDGVRKSTQGQSRWGWGAEQGTFLLPPGRGLKSKCLKECWDPGNKPK